MKATFDIFGFKKRRDERSEGKALKIVFSALNGIAKNGLKPLTRDEYRGLQSLLRAANRLTNYEYPYLVDAIQTHLLYALDNEKVKLDPEVYVLLFQDETVKIGIAANVGTRAKTISSSKGFEVVKSWASGPIADAKKIEYAAHQHFKANRLKGEYFKIGFDEAVAAVESLIAE